MQPTATTRPSPAYARIQDLLAAERCVILDGGVATELQRERPLEGHSVRVKGLARSPLILH